MLMRGSRGPMVEATQAFLADTGAYEGRLDGIYGPKTERAVKKWQGYLNVRSDGRWGPKTNRATLEAWKALTGEIAAERDQQPVVPTLPKGP